MIAWRQLHGGVDTWIHAGCRNPGSSRVSGGSGLGNARLVFSRDVTGDMFSHWATYKRDTSP
jgi:hypothetical protein